MKRKELRAFWVTGQKGLTYAEAAKAIVDEAREVLQKDLGTSIDWSSSQDREKSISLSVANGRDYKVQQNVVH